MFLLLLGLMCWHIAPVVAAPTILSIQLDFAPGALTTDSVNNRIYVVDPGAHQIRVIDGATGSLLPNSFPVDSTLGVFDIAVDGARRRLFVDYYCSGCWAYVQVFDIDTYQEVSKVQAYGPGGMVVNPDNGRLYVPMGGSQYTVWVLYPNDTGGYFQGNIITGFGGDPGDVTYDRLHQRLYVSIHHANAVAVVDTSTETLINTVPVLAGNPTSVAVNPNNRHVYVGQNLGNRISVVDGATETALPDITLGDGPVLVDVDPTTARVFVGLREAQSVGIIDGNTDTFLSPLLPIYGAPISVSVNTTDHCAYVSVNSYIGQNSIFKVCDNIQSPRLARWKQTTALPKVSATTFLTGKELTIVDGRAYVFGGQNANTMLLTNVYFSTVNADGSLGPWAQTTPLPKPYFDHAVVNVGTNLYLITGANGSMDVYYAPILADGSVGQWIQTVPLDPSRQAFAAAAHGNFIYVAGGNAGGLRDFVKFTSVKPDGSLNPWLDTTPLPQPVQGHTLVAIRGRLYVVMPSGEVYYAAINPSDGKVGNWTATSSLPAPVGGYSTFELNGYLYLVGGNPNSAYYAQILADGSLAAWQPNTLLPAIRMGVRAGAYNNFVYVAGGYDGANFFRTVYYSPLANKVGGSATGLQVAGVSCVNNKTSQTVNVAHPTATWNCEEAGLAVNSKDGIRMTVTGSVDLTAPVGGSSTGLLLNSVRCINDTTRQAFTIDMKNLPPSWNCEAAGLQVNSRDIIRMNINGGAE